MDCLLVIDPQMDFVSPDGAYAKKGHGTACIRNCLGNINEYLSRTTDRRILVYSNYSVDQFGPGLDLCIPGTPGHRVALSLDQFDLVLAKTDHDAFKYSDLGIVLSELQPEQVRIAGFLLEYCVRETALSLLSAGWPVSILEDLIATGDDVLHRKNPFLQEIQSLGGMVQKSVEV
ncbi:MAG: hypothetical protein CMF59_03485 [Leptospiraceae bacterium]|nr:hypothetical protein [Leptospiraceae bacterium]